MSQAKSAVLYGLPLDLLMNWFDLRHIETNLVSGLIRVAITAWTLSIT